MSTPKKKKQGKWGPDCNEDRRWRGAACPQVKERASTYGVENLA